MPSDVRAADPKYILSVILEAMDHTDLRKLVDTLVRPLTPAPSRLIIDGTSVGLPSETVASFALILCELASNAIMHGAWSCDVGRVTIHWRTLPTQHLDFCWSERDGPAITPPVRLGLGSSVIKIGLNRSDVDYQLKPEGLTCRIKLPLP
jgi:two-component sensor histidine kinase